MSLIEVTCVLLAIHVGQEATCDVAPQEVAQQPEQLSGGSMWEQVDSFSLEDVFSHRVGMLKTCPHFMRGRLRECFEIAFMERHRAEMESDELGELRAWELFGLVPIILLHRPRGTGAVGRSELGHRAEEFARDIGGHSGKKPFGTRQHTQEVVQNAATKRRVNAEERLHKRGCREGRSPGRDRNSQVLRLHPRTKPHCGSCALGDPRSSCGRFPQEVMEFVPTAEVSLSGKLFATCLREAPSGSSPGPGGCTNEMLKGIWTTLKHCTS